MGKVAAIFLALALMTFGASARVHHGGIAAPPSTCPYGFSYSDGCAGANQSALFQNPTFFSTVQQSGQGSYAARPPWNVAGVDYPVGQYTPDNLLTDVSTNVPAGCSLVSASRWIRCGSGVTLAHYRFNGWGIYADVSPVVLDDVHFTMTADNCRNYNGIGYISTHGGTGDITITNSTFDFDSGCAFNADLYKQASDPGFVTQSSGTASFSGTALTYSSISSGTVRIGQYIDCPGCVKAMITAGSGLSWTVNASQGTLGPVTVTTGPVQTNMNGPISMASSGKVTLKYNANFDSGQFSSAINELELRFNYSKIISANAQHVNIVFNTPSAGTTANFIEEFNTAYWDHYAEDSGTGLYDYFATSTGAANTGQVTVTNLSLSYNVAVANNSLPNNSLNTNSLVRFLSQTANSGPGRVGTASYSLAGGVANVTSFTPLTGSETIAVGDFLGCNSTLPSCTNPIQIVSFGTGTGGTGTYNVTNSTDSLTKSSQVVVKYPGAITTGNFNYNYFDRTGTQSGNNAWNFDMANVPIGTLNSTGNVNMLTGNSCNYGGTCN